MVVTNSALQTLAALESDMDELSRILVRHDLKSAVEQIREKREDLGRPNELLTFVVGEGNFGKSSLINALLGRDVAAVSILPKTWRIDLYRALPQGTPEFANIRFAGKIGFTRYAIEKAQELCQAQEISFKSQRRIPTDVGEAEPEGKIVEVQWHYTGLALDSSIVLVDTPGFSQFRPGQNSSRLGTLSQAGGVAFELDEVYEYYFHRANLVLWAFKADKYNDADTERIFNDLSRRNKTISGVLTYVDIVPESQRGELRQRVETKYGKRVSSFFPVIAGGRSLEKGYGVPELRGALAEMSPRVAQLKRQEMESFLRMQANNGALWVKKIGDVLIHNIMQVSLYCNGVSTALLRSAKDHHSQLSGRYKGWVGADSLARRTTLRPKIDALLHFIANHESVRFNIFGAPDYKVANLQFLYGQQINDILCLPQLEQATRSVLQVTGDYVRVEALRVASELHLQQAIIGAMGATRTRRIEANVIPPDNTNRSAPIPRVEMPPLPEGIVNISRIFGNAKVNPSHIDWAIDDVARKVDPLIEFIHAAISQYVRETAETIVISAEEAMKIVYPDATLAELGQRCAAVDSDLIVLNCMTQGTGEEMVGQLAYESVYRIWSPRDDARVAALELVSTWLALTIRKRKSELNDWLSHAQIDQAFPRKALSQQIVKWVKRNQPANSTPLARFSAALPLPEFPLQETLTSIGGKLTGACPLTTEVTNATILKNFDYFRLEGLVTFVTEAVIEKFKKDLSGWHDTTTIPRFKSEVKRPIVTRDVVGLCAAVGTTITGINLGISFSPIYLAGLHFGPAGLVALYGVANAGTVSGVLAGGAAALRYAQHRAHRNDLVEKITTCYMSGVSTAATTLWESNIEQLTITRVRQILGERTLVERRPLDFAFEGVF